MLLHALLIPFLLPAPLSPQQLPLEGIHEHGHGEDFTSMLEHRAFPDLARWKERHPWRVGTELRKFVLRLGDERAKGDVQLERKWNMHAAFLAEAIHGEVTTAWLITVHNYDVEARALFDTVRRGLADIAASVQSGPEMTDEAILGEIDGLRAPIAPPWCFESCLEELTRIAEAAQAKGRGKAAVALAREVQTIADRTHDGEIALWCATFLLRAEQAAGRKAEASGQVRRLLEAAGAVERLPADFEGLLTEIQKSFTDEPGVAVGVQSLRAVRLEHEENLVEALALWKTALKSSTSLRPAIPELEQVEKALYGPDPARRGALAAARMGRYDDAREMGQAACWRSLEGETIQNLGPAENGLLTVVVDRAATVVVLTHSTPETRGCIVPVGANSVRTHVEQVRQSLHKVGAEAGKPPTIPFDPTFAREAYEALLRPLNVPLRGRIGVLGTPELAQLPFGALVIDEWPGPPPRPRYLAEEATFLRWSECNGLPEVDDATRSAVKKRLDELAAKPGELGAALRTVQLEMIEGRGPLGAARTHPWYWADLELARP
ncbi:MAG: hypothetical protein ACKVXR_16510 [Planctomycetota bacterium]